MGLGFLKPAQSSSSQSVVGIDVGSSSIKVIQLKKKGGKAVLETYGEIALGPYASTPVGSLTNLKPEEIVEAIKQIFKESQITTNNAAIAIPSSASLIFILEIPGVLGEKELKDVVPIEARRYIPVPISEVSLDWWMIPKREEESEDQKKENVTEVLVVAIHNETVVRYQEIVEKSGLGGAFYEIEIFSNIRSVLGHDLSSVLLMDIGASKTKLAIVDNGVVKKFHVISRGSYDISSNLSKSLGLPFGKAEEVKKEYGLEGVGTNKNISDTAKLIIDYIFSETKDIILDYEKRNNKTVSKMILSGGGAMLKGLLPAAKASFNLDVIISDPFSHAETPEFLKDALKTSGPPFSVAVGLALRKLQ